MHIIPSCLPHHCCCSVAKSCLTLCDLMKHNTPGFPVLQYLPEYAQTHVHWVSDGIQPSHPLSPPSVPALNLFQHLGLFQWVCSSHQVAKVLDLQLQHWSFIQGWFPLALTGLILLSTGLSSLLQHHSSKASVLWHSAFFMVQFLHPYMTTGKPYLWLYTPLLVKWCLLFNGLSRFVIAFLPRSKCLSISWLHSLSAVILEPRKIKFVAVSSFSPFICHEVMCLTMWPHYPDQWL